MDTTQTIKAILTLSCISLAGISLFIKGLIDLKIKRVIENISTSKIRSIAIGLVEIKGSAFAKKYFTSPLLKSKCVYYDTKIQEYKYTKKSGRYVTINSLTNGKYFYVKDDTGKVMIDSKYALIDVSTKHTYYTKDKIDNKVKTLLKEQNIDYKNFLGSNKNIRVIETLITAGQQIYVFGTAKNNYLDKNKNTTKNEDELIITKSKGNFFIVSDKKERELIQKYKWIFPLEVIGGGLLFAASIIWIISIL